MHQFTILRQNLQQLHDEWKVIVFTPDILHLWRKKSYQWLSARLQYLQCISNGDAAVLH